MDLVAHAIVSLEDTRLFLGYSDSSKDEKIKLMINVATDMIETYTGRRFIQTTYTDQPFDGNGEDEVLLPQYPVTSLTSLGKNGSYDNSPSWDVIDSEDYFLNGPSGILKGVSRFSRGTQNYRATYVAGYLLANVPWDLKFAAMQMVEYLMNKQAAAGIVSERLGDHSVTYKQETVDQYGIPDAVRIVLDKHKRPNL